MLQPTLKEARRREKAATIYDTYDGRPCELCGSGREVLQDSDFFWVCPRCYWTRTNRIQL